MSSFLQTNYEGHEGAQEEKMIAGCSYKTSQSLANSSNEVKTSKHDRLAFVFLRVLCG
jgi:hypothetical protein